MGCARRLLPIPALAAAAALLAALDRTGTAPARAIDTTGPAVSHAPPTDPAVLDALRRPVSVAFDRVPLDRAVRRVAEAAGVSVEVDWESLETASAPRDQPVTLRLRDVPAEHALALLMMRFRGVIDVRPWPRGGGARIGPRPPDEAPDRVGRAYPVLPRGWLAAGPQAREDALREWQDLVVQTVAPDAWEENGGARGTVRADGLSLVVTTTPEIQQEVADLLAKVAAAAAGRDALAARPPPRRPPGPRMTFHVDAVPLRRALARWQAVVAVNVVVDVRAMEEAGVDLDRPVTVHAAGAPAERVLADILSAAQPAGDDAGEPAGPRLGAEVDRYGVLIVGPADGLPATVVVRCYNLRPVVSRPSKAWPAGTPAEDRMAAVEDWLVRNVDADSWRDNGGSVGGLRLMGRVLVVTQRPDAHDRIAAALRDRAWDRPVQPPAGDGDDGAAATDPQTGQAGSR